MKRLRLLHPLFYLLLSLLFLYKNAWVIASPYQFVRAFLILAFAFLFIALPSYWMARNQDWTAILLTIIVLGFFSPTSIFIIAGILNIAILGIYFGSSYILKRRVLLQHASIFLTVTGILLNVMIVLPHAGLFELAFTRASKPVYPQLDLVPMTQQPDIYYIVLDGYAREDILTELYAFDNSLFINQLKELGFIVPSESHSNYAKTALSVASTLNMDYLHSFAPGLENQPFWWRMEAYIDHSRVRAALESIGYRSFSLASDWGITNNSTTDEYLSPKKVIPSDFESFVLGRTPLGVIRPFMNKLALVPSYETHRELIQFNFDTLAQISAVPGPKFVFAHILVPHPPFVYNADGTPLNPNYPFNFNDGSDFPMGANAYLQGYVGQLQYTNYMLENLIDTILRDSVISPIIILQADHGPGMFTDFSSSANTCLKERFSVFAAYYLPNVSTGDVPTAITPVNLFRIIFNNYFQGNMPLLQNTSYYYTDTVYIYRTEDVTEHVDTCVVK